MSSSSLSSSTLPFLLLVFLFLVVFLLDLSKLSSSASSSSFVQASPGRGRSSGGGGWFGSSSKSKSSGGGGWFGSSSKSKSSGGGGGWFGSNKKQNNNYNSGGYGNNYKKKSKYSTLKKAAVIGAVAYGGYQLGKLTSRFGQYGGGHYYGGGGGGGGRWGFNEWNRWRQIDGFMCRDNNDCAWIDPRLYCQDYELDFTPSALWFGGDVARIVGECDCPRSMVWDDYEMQCRNSFFGGVGAILSGLVVTIIILGCCCCCVGAAFCFMRR